VSFEIGFLFSRTRYSIAVLSPGGDLRYSFFSSKRTAARTLRTALRLWRTISDTVV
jgi:hypothetical protein